MFNPAIIKKKDSKLLKIDKQMAKHAMSSLEPEEKEDEMEDGEEEKPMKGKMTPEAKVEIEIMLQAAKKKKK